MTSFITKQPGINREHQGLIASIQELTALNSTHMGGSLLYKCFGTIFRRPISANYAAIMLAPQYGDPEKEAISQKNRSLLIMGTPGVVEMDLLEDWV